MGKRQTEMNGTGAHQMRSILGAIGAGEEAATISGRLEKKFGLGSNPAARKKLYLFCEAAVEQFGEAAYQAISEAVASAVHARKDSGHYFARAVKLKLRERGFGPKDDADEGW